MITIKQGQKMLSRIDGHPMEIDLNTIADKVLDLESTLEKITGLRFHISIEGAEDSPALPTLDRLLQEERDSRRNR
jgi:hypothetical protein